MKEKTKKTELTMKDVFVECGSTVQNHGKLCKSLRKIYNNVSLDEFWAEFIRLLKYSMMIYAREPVVERTIDFVTKFVSSLTETGEEKGAKDEAVSGDVSEVGVEVGAEENPLLSRLITFLLQSHSACNQSVRFRSCQLINKLLNGLGDNAHIDDDLYEGIFSAMLERVRDKLPLVRVQAVLALARLQDPADKDCPVIKAYLFLISCDPSPDVRRAVLTSIAPSTKTLSAILERTRDVKDAVRKAAYQIIADKIHIKALSIAQRLQLLEDGLNDRAESVVKACGNQLLQGWLRASAGNVLELLKNLDVESSVETCERALTTMFTASSLSELVANFDLLGDKMLMDQSKLNGETAMYWSSLCKYVHSLGHSQEQLLEMVLPACVHFCDYLRQYLTVCRECTDLYEQLEHEFVLQQLLNMTTFMDLSDQAGRKALQKLLDDLLLDAAISHSLVRHVMPHLVTLYTDTDALVTHLAETISDIREPISVVETQPSDEERRQSDLKLARVRVDLNQLREDMDEAIHQQDFVRAAEVKEKVSAMELIKAELTQALEPHTEEVRTEKTDPQTWMKCLSIVCELLENAPITSLTPVLQMLVESLILPAVQKEDPNVRNLAMKALGLCCLLKKEAALQNLVLFVQASQVDTEGVRATALSVLFDLLHQYGLEVLQIELGGTSDGESPGEESNSTPADESRPGEGLDETEESTEAGEGTDEKAAGPTANTASSLLTILSSALDIESSELRTVAAEGLAKLLLSGRVQSAKLLSHLLLLWYNPVTEDDTHLRHCLGAFFPVFAIAGRSNQEVVEESFMLTMRTLFNAPSSSPLADVDANNVADLLVQLTSSRLLSQNNKISRDQITDHVIHNNLALTVCNEILSHADSFSVRVLVKTLNSLDIDKDDESLLKNLHTLSQQMLEAVKEKTCVKGLQKFQAGLEETLSKYEKPAPPPGGDGHMENTQENAEDVDSESIRPEVKQEPVEGQERCGQGEITADQKPGAITKTPLPKSARKKSKAAKTPSANLTVPVTDLENSVFLSPTPIRKSSAKPKPTNVSCDALDDSKLKALTNGSRKLSNRRVLFDVDNTSLQQPPDAE